MSSCNHIRDAALLPGAGAPRAATQLVAAVAEQPVAPARAPSAPGQLPGGSPPWAGLPNGRVRSPDWLALSGAGGSVSKPEGLEPLGPAGRVCSPGGFAPLGPPGSSGRFAQPEQALRLRHGAGAHAAGPHCTNGAGDSTAGGSSSGSIMAGGGGSAVGMMQAGRRAVLGVSLVQRSDHGPGGSGSFGGLAVQVCSSSKCEWGMQLRLASALHLTENTHHTARGFPEPPVLSVSLWGD